MDVGDFAVKFQTQSDQIEAALQRIKEQSDSAAKAGKEAEEQGERTGAAWEKLKEVATFAFWVEAIKKVVEAGKELVEAGSEAQSEMTQVKTRVEAAGLSFDQFGPKIDAYSQKMIKMGFDDEDTAQSMSRLLNITKNWDTAAQYNAGVMDLARDKHISLNEATNVYASVLAGNTRILKQYGIEVSSTASAQDVLGQLMDKTKGQAEAYAQSMEGQISILKVQLQNIAEDAGQKLFPSVSQLLSSFSEIAPTIANVFVQVASTVGNALTQLMPLLQTIGQGLATVLTDAAPILEEIVNTIGQLGSILAPYIPQIAQFIGSTLQLLAPLLGEILNALVQIFGALAPLLPVIINIAAEILQGIMPAITSLVNIALTILVPAIMIIINAVISLISYLEDVGKVLVGVFTGNISLIKEGIKGFGDTWKQTNEDIQKSIDSLTQKNASSAKQITDNHTKMTSTIVQNHSKVSNSLSKLSEDQKKWADEWVRKAAEAQAKVTTDLQEQSNARLKAMEIERKQALDNANNTGKSIDAINATYDALEKKEKDETAKAILKQTEDAQKKLLNDQISFDQKQANNEALSLNKRQAFLKRITAARLKLLQDEEKQELINAGNNEQAKLAIEQDYQAKIDALNVAEVEGTQNMYSAQTQSMIQYAVDLGSGAKTIKGIVEQMACDAIDIYENQLKAEAAMGIAKAWAEAGGIPYIAIPLSIAITAEELLGIAALEAGKSAIQGLVNGGIVTDSGSVLVGEDGPELLNLPKAASVVPLDHSAAQLNKTTQSNVTNNNDNQKSNTTVNLLSDGVLIADKIGLQKLQRVLRDFEIKDNIRRGIKNP